MQFLSLALAVFVGVLAAKLVAFWAHGYYTRYREWRYGNPLFPLKPLKAGETVPRRAEAHPPVAGIPNRGAV